MIQYMDRVKVPMHHALKKIFYTYLREAFFIWDPECMAQAIDALRRSGKSEEDIELMR